MPTEYDQALAMMNKRRKTLKCMDFKHTVEIQHGDGSHFLLHDAILEKKKFGKFEMLLVFTEHCGYHAFYCDDLEFWRKYKIVN